MNQLAYEAYQVQPEDIGTGLQANQRIVSLVEVDGSMVQLIETTTPFHSRISAAKCRRFKSLPR